MGLIKKAMVLALVILILNLYLPNIFIPFDTSLFAKENKTKYPLEIRSTPEVEMTEKKEQVKSNWWWLGLLGATVVGGIAALAGGGGTGGGGGDDDEPTGGSIVGSW